MCLERLDTTAKVLPCQHTFCRRCLESIVSSRHELRCPECRILVGCGVDELPANILLVRLLDGIRQRPRTAGGASGSPGSGVSSYPQPAAAAASSPSSAVAAAAASAAASLRELAAASRSALLGKVGAGPRGGWWWWWWSCVDGPHGGPGWVRVCRRDVEGRFPVRGERGVGPLPALEAGGCGVCPPHTHVDLDVKMGGARPEVSSKRFGGGGGGGPRVAGGTGTPRF